MNTNEQSKKLYRYMGICELCKLLRGKIYLTRLEHWHSEDPLENFISQGKSELPDDTVVGWENFASETYAICFTKNPEDAWDIFDKSHIGKVRVECNYECLQQLCRTIKEAYILKVRENQQPKKNVNTEGDNPLVGIAKTYTINEIEKNYCTFPDLTPEYLDGIDICGLRDVRYESEDRIKQEQKDFQEGIIATPTCIDPAYLLDKWLIKNKRFENQQEVRLVTDWNSEKHQMCIGDGRNVLEFDVAPKQLIDSITVPSYFPEADERIIRALVAETFGQDKMIYHRRS